VGRKPDDKYVRLGTQRRYKAWGERRVSTRSHSPDSSSSIVNRRLEHRKFTLLSGESYRKRLKTRLSRGVILSEQPIAVSRGGSSPTLRGKPLDTVKHRTGGKTNEEEEQMSSDMYNPERDNKAKTGRTQSQGAYKCWLLYGYRG
jgi:hypothetical protein